MTFEQIQQNLRSWIGNDFKPGTQKCQLIESTYLKALQDTGANVPPICWILLSSNRSMINYTVPKND